MKARATARRLAQHVKKAATERVFGFEIMPAPFVVAHLQVGLTMQSLDAPLSGDGKERPSIFLTNALTGWEPREHKTVSFPELEEERERAEHVKQQAPVLVILGNPPYNGYAGMAVDEERVLSNAYRETKLARKPEGQGLNDLYVRFFRMAERRIVEKTGQGVVCFISNYSWLDGLSFSGMRERYLDAFDVIRIDNLNGDRFKTGKTTPDGKPDPSIFSTAKDPVGIQVGTAITTLVRKRNHTPAKTVGTRQIWGKDKRAELVKTAESEPNALYDDFRPDPALGLPFKPMAVSKGWSEWPALPDLFPTSFPGVKTSRDSLVVDVDFDRLKARITDYFDSAGMSQLSPDEASFIRYAYRPYDTRWLYWGADGGLLDRPRPDYKPHVFAGNIWLEARQREAREDFSRGTLTHHMADNFGNGLSHFFPVWLRDKAFGTEQINGTRARPNLSLAAQSYLDKLGMGVEDLFHHTLAVLHDPAYREANAGALRMEWPRIPMPGWPDGDTDGDTDGAADKLRESAAKGRQLAALLDPDTPVPGVTTGTLRPELAAIAVPTTVDGHNMTADDFSLTAGWGHLGQGEAVMPGQGRAVPRDYTSAERADMGDAAKTPDDKTVDVYLNDAAYWSNIPDAVWNYKLGGYQVLKKWLSYREHKILNRPLSLEEVQHLTNTARRIAAILGLTSHG